MVLGNEYFSKMFHHAPEMSVRSGWKTMELLLGFGCVGKANSTEVLRGVRIENGRKWHGFGAFLPKGISEISW